MPTATEELIDFRQYLDFNSSNRAQCPVCIADGKKNRNIAISPEGKIKCHRDCSFPDILNALGIDTKAPANQAPVAKRIAAQSATTTTDKKPVYQSLQQIEANHQTLLTQSKIAKEWLAKRGIDDQAIARHKLGIAKYSFRGKTYPCITIPYNRKGGWQNKYFPAPWLPKAERLDGEGEETRAMQDTGSKADWYFTLKNDAPELWIVEGEWDAMLLAGDFIANNITNIDICTGTGGCGTIPIDMSPIDSYQHIYIWYDLDYVNSKGKRPGPDGSAKLAAKIGDRAISCTVPHPENHKDGWDVSDALLNGFTIADFEKVKHREYTDEEKQAIAILKKAPVAMAHDYEAFVLIGRSLKSISDHLLPAWWDWAWTNFSRYTSDKGYMHQIWQELGSDMNGLEALASVVRADFFLPPSTSKTKIKKLLEKMFGNRLRLNNMTHYVEQDGIRIKPDYLYLDLMDYGIESSKDFVVDNFFKLAEKNQYDPLTEYLEGCYAKYGDSTLHLLDTPAKTYLKTTEDIYDVYLRKTLIAAAARALSAGCKVDTVFVLYGAEGLQKTTFFEILAGQWFEGGLGGNVGDTNEMMKMAASWICEWGEIERIFGQKDTSTIKAFLTRREDVFRRPWGRTMEKTPRRSIIVASTNRDDFLSDPTGNRRYWVVKCEQDIQTEKLKEDRDKIWAAAVAMFKRGEMWWLTKAEEALRTDRNKDFTSEEIWFEKIQYYVNSAIEGKVTTSEVLENALKVETAHQDRGGQMRVSKVLGELGWKKKKSHGVIYWVKPQPVEIANEVSPVSPVSPSLSQLGIEAGDTLSFSIEKIEGIPQNQGIPIANNSGDTFRGIPLKSEVSPAESLASNGFQASGDTGDTENGLPSEGLETAKIPFYAGQIVRAKSGGLVGQNLTIQSVNAKTCIVRKDGASSTIELPTKILEKV
jgi:predicted P-loop ATPase